MRALPGVESRRDVVTLTKKPESLRIRPKLREDDVARKSFSWADVRRRLDGLPGGCGLNIAHEAVDRHAMGPLGARIALRWIGRSDEPATSVTWIFAPKRSASRMCSGISGPAAEKLSRR